jgi:hypothetical protein
VCFDVERGHHVHVHAGDQLYNCLLRKRSQRPFNKAPTIAVSWPSRSSTVLRFALDRCHHHSFFPSFRKYFGGVAHVECSVGIPDSDFWDKWQAIPRQSMKRRNTLRMGQRYGFPYATILCNIENYLKCSSSVAYKLCFRGRSKYRL